MNDKLKELIKEEISRVLKESMKDESVDKGTIVDTLASLRRTKALPHLRGPSGQKEFYKGYEQALKDATNKLMKLKPEDSIWSQDYSDDLRRESSYEDLKNDKQEAIEAYYNFYKDVHGFKPRGESFEGMTASDVWDMVDELLVMRGGGSSMDTDEMDPWHYADDNERDRFDDMLALQDKEPEPPKETEHVDDPDFSFGTFADLFDK